MNVEKVKRELSKKYPGVNIKENVDSSGVVIEIVGEIDRKLADSKRDVAVIVSDRSPKHFHNYVVEEYEVLKGNLRVYRDGKPTDLSVGESIIIEPGAEHWTEGNETWFYCYSEPDWTPDDYHPVD